MGKLIDLAVPVYSISNIESIELAEDGQPARQWSHLFTAGEWFNVRHGRVPITTDDLKIIHDNFKNGRHPQSPVECPVDYEHLSTQPNRKPGDGEAAGWFKDLQLRANGSQLWGLIEWIDEAADKIRKKKYRFLSPTFHPNFVAHGEAKIGPTLVGAALTNYPTMPLEALTCSLDPTIATIVPPESVVRDANMKTFKVKNTKGEDVEISLDALNSVDVKELSTIPAVDAAIKAAAKPPEGAKVITVDEWQTMSTQMSTLSSTVNQQQAKIDDLTTQNTAYKTAAIEAEIGVLMSQGRILPSEKDGFIALAQKDRALYDQFMTARKAAPPLINLNQSFGHGNSGGGTGNAGTGALAQFNDKVSAHRAANPNKSFADCLRDVASENRELADLARQEESVRL